MCVSAHRTFSGCCALMLVISVCRLNVMPLSILTPRIFVGGDWNGGVIQSGIGINRVFSVVRGYMRE